MQSRLAIALTFVVSILLAGACAGTAERGAPNAVLDRAIDAMGGAQALDGMKTLVMHGSHRHYEPQQSRRPDQGERFGGESTLVTSMDVTNAAVRIDWERKLVAPRPSQLKYSEVLAYGVGYVYGIDSSSRTAESLKSNPPQHRMSRVRLAAAQREVERISPRLLLDMRANPTKVSVLPEQPAGERQLPSLRYQIGQVVFIVLFDPATGLPARVRTVDTDAMWGDSNYDVEFSDWRQVGELKLPFAYTYTLAGRRTSEMRLDEVRVNVPLAAGLFDVPAHARSSQPAMSVSEIPYQWVIRRGHWGSLVDNDAIVIDPRASKGLRLDELAPGVSHMVVGSHNSLVVELRNYLVVFEAPISERQSEMTIAAAKKRYPGKPIRYLVLTHPHMDHASGLRTFVAEGADVIVGQGNGDYIRRMLTAPHTVQPDRLERNPREAQVIEVRAKHVLSDGTRSVELFVIDNTHADGMLIGYIPQAKLGFVTDLWSPGRDRIGPTTGQTELVRAVLKLGIPVERFAGGHGTSASFKPLADAVMEKGG